MTAHSALIMAVTYKKAALLEQWQINHRGCPKDDPEQQSAPTWVSWSDDLLEVNAECTCGEMLNITITLDVVAKVQKCQAA